MTGHELGAMNKKTELMRALRTLIDPRPTEKELEAEQELVIFMLQEEGEQHGR